MEDFTSNSTPTCWNQSSQTGGPWVFSGSPGYDMAGTSDHTNGVVNGDFAWMDFSSSDVAVVLETPEFDVGSASTVMMSFWSKSYYTGSLTPFNLLYVEAFDGSTWSQVDVYQGDTGPDWVENILDVSAHIYDNAGVNTVKLRFRAESGGNSNDFYNDIAIDDFLIYDPANFCAENPTNLISTSATATSVTLDWDLSTGGAGNSYIIEHGPVGFTPGTFTNVQNETTSSGTVSGLTSGNTYDFYVYHVCTNGDTSFVEGPVSVTAQCSPVIDFYVNTASNSDANVEWVSTGANFIVEYGATGFNPGSGTSNSVTSNTTQDITGLTTNSFYDAYVRVICGPGDTSIYYGPVTFNTYGVGQFIDWDVACPTIGFVDISGTGTDLGLTDDSEAGITLPFPILYQGNLITDITVGNNGGVILGTQTGNVGFGGNFNTMADGTLYIWGDDLDSETGNVYWDVVGSAPNRTLIIHWHNICNFSGSVGAPTVNFQMQFEEATQEFYYVYDDVIFGGSNSNDDYGDNADIGIAGTQDITVSSSDPNFLMNNSCAHFFYTDCPNVENLQVTTYDYNQIGLTWNQGLAQETQWTIVYGLEGFDPATGGLGTITTSNTFDTITGLDQLTDYDVYVYADCDPTAPLSSSGMLVQHQTAPECANPFGIGSGAAPDSIFASWNWQPNNSGQLPVNYNVTYVPSGQGVYGPTATEYNTGSAVFADTIVDQNLIASGVYDMYVQTVCASGDTSLYVGPVNFLAFLDNDSSCFAQELQVNGSAYILYNNGAQNDPGIAAIEPPTDGFYSTQGWGQSQIYRSTWYTFTAPASGDMMITGTDVNYLSKMAVYETTNCGDYSQYNLIGANDNGVLFGNTNAPEWAVCGLTPGQTYYLLHSAQYSYTGAGTYSIRLEELDFNAGSATGIVDACIGDTVDLFNGITGYDVQYGTWIDLANTSQLITANDFATTVLASQVYDFEYRVELGCSYDSVVGQVQIYPPSSAGEDGSINVCKNEPINLFTGLSGNVDLGGTWYDPQDAVVNSNIPASGTIPGQFNYDYIAGNGVCPDDTALVVVIVDAGCDFLGLNEEMIEGISVYPNPTSGILNITSSGQHEELNVSIVDVNGRIVLDNNDKLSSNSEIKLNLEGLTTGVYMIQLSNENTKNTYRIIVQ
ncbi:Por secretion system C-terminal sorting domain-containing protein [Lishizhenia tianjinensis]|uniref:Por secretion system C-terminal sorting domain-containing protein n=1 Tax=Lishizhenia tianjinensis TaxID=477690 RepID=A0A1I7AWI9_9FLAO|nr:T9SS type A sorting domain-containing protein [Lishizhenia tianjinensis]SFT79312.1 Por secretion system C-terminal sorting domain-containing protein [Lishizhenia tianjinensis]